jgi:hypothetical protein
VHGASCIRSKLCDDRPSRADKKSKEQITSGEEKRGRSGEERRGEKRNESVLQ